MRKLHVIVFSYTILYHSQQGGTTMYIL